MSRAVNGRPGVTDETRRKILRILAELGYEQPGVARPRRGGLVGLLVPELDNPIFPAFAQAIETRLAGQGFTSLLCTATIDGKQEAEYIDLLLERAVDGVVVVSGLNADTAADHGLYRQLAGLGVPLVLLNGEVPDLDAPTVSADEVSAAERAVEHLASLGHRRIGLITGPERYQPVQRKGIGFARAMAALGVTDVRDLVVESTFSVEGGEAAAGDLLEQDVTAIVASSDLMALGAIRAVRERGRRVPEHVSVVGYDDTALMAYTDPPLTTLRQPVQAMSDAACRALLDRMRGQSVPSRELLFRCELIVRRSTGPAPTRRRLKPSGRRSQDPQE